MTTRTQTQRGNGEDGSSDTLDRTIDRALAGMSREPAVDVRAKVLARLGGNDATEGRTGWNAGRRTWGLVGAGVVGTAALAAAVLWPASRQHVSRTETTAIVSPRAGGAHSETARSSATEPAEERRAAEAMRAHVTAERPPAVAAVRPRATRLPEPGSAAPSGVASAIDNLLFLNARLPDVEPISVEPIRFPSIDAAPLSEPPIVVPPIVMPPVGSQSVSPPDARPGRGASREPSSASAPEGERQ